MSIIVIMSNNHDNDSVQSCYHDKLYISVITEANIIVLKMRKS